MTTTTFAEAKSRHIAPAKSVHDFQIGDGFLIKSGETVTRKIVKDINKDANSLSVADPDGGGVMSVTLNPDSPAKDGQEFKYWIDEGEIDMVQRMLEQDDLPADAFDDDFPVSPEDEIDALDDPGFAEDLKSFLGEEGSAAGSQVPDNTVGGSVSGEHDDEDGEGTEDTPAPHDTTGMQSGGEVNTMAGGSSSNVGGSAPSDEVSTHGAVGGSPTIDATLPQKGEHDPGTPDKAQGGGVSEAIRSDVDTALSLTIRGADPKSLAPRLLRGAGV